MIITIPGEPVAQGRPRACVVRGKVRVYDPPTSRAWKEQARAIMVGAVGSAHLPLHPDGAVRVEITACFALPRSKHRKVPIHTELKTSRPDADNLAKAVMDAGNGVLWADDGQVAELRVSKWTQGQVDRPPHVEIRVEREA